MYNDPFYFAIRHDAPTSERANVPAYLKATYGVVGKIEHARTEPEYRLYRVIGG